MGHFYLKASMEQESAWSSVRVVVLVLMALLSRWLCRAVGIGGASHDPLRQKGNVNRTFPDAASVAVNRIAGETHKNNKKKNLQKKKTLLQFFLGFFTMNKGMYSSKVAKVLAMNRRANM